MIVMTVLLLASCSDDDGAGKAASDETTTSSTTSTSLTTSTTSTTITTTSTTAFEGTTTATTVPMATDHTTLLTGVEVSPQPGFDRVAFRFEGSGTPLVDIGYVSEVRAAGSGELVAVEGDAFLSVRMEPASTVDLRGEEVERTYTGPDRVRAEGTATVTEVVRTGDFEANLTWVIGARGEAPFRVYTDRRLGAVVVELAAPNGRR